MKIWIVSQVKRGFIQEPEIFNYSAQAERRRRELRRDFNPDYDELEIFEKEINIGRRMSGEQGEQKKCKSDLKL